ncbi:helix-turn-helix domain-containing protein [Streptomyces sp. NPDC006339]|uniref:helix-turn-helix domain-containing protein n=1 Tax=Streptomyces sp. NPDC006339 TaxID=3156755 RepID=UPI0033AF0572
MTETDTNTKTGTKTGTESAGRAGRGVLEGAFALLDALRRRGGEAGLTELAAACGVPKATAHRLLDQLGPVGAVERRGSRYVLGPQLFKLGESWQPYPGLRDAARLPLHRLRAATGAGVVLAVPHGGRALTVASVPGRAGGAVSVREGTAFPVGTAVARALDGREHGPSVDRGTRSAGRAGAGVDCVAVPVRGPGGRVVAVVAATAPAGGNLAPVVAATVAAASAVSAGLAGGHRARGTALASV